MKSMVTRILSAATIAISCNAQAVLVTTVDLTLGTGNSGVANGAVFSNPANTTTVGTGVLDPFLRIQQQNNEQGFNTDGAVSLDTKPGTWTHAIQLGNIGQITGDGTLSTVNGTVYRQFFLDINQDNGNGNLLSLDVLQIRIGSSATPATFAAAGTLVFDLDALGDAAVLMDYDLFNGSGNGLDVGFLIPEAVFTGFTATDYLTMYADFGRQPGYRSTDGFEEFAAARCATTLGCGPVTSSSTSSSTSSGTTSGNIPEPGSSGLVFLGLGLVGASFWARRRGTKAAATPAA